MKYSITCLLIFFALSVKAQNEGVEVIPRETKFIGGSLFISFDENIYKAPDIDDAKYNYTSISIGPVGGKYIRDNIALGLYLSYGYLSYKQEYSDSTVYKDSDHSVYVGSFVRRNYKIIPNLFFFIQAQASLGYGNSKTINTSDNETKSRNGSISLGGAPGLQLFLGKKISLETTLGYVGYRFYRSKNVDSDDITINHNVDFGGGLSSVNFSIRYFIFQ